jgi:hypothetical protein
MRFVRDENNAVRPHQKCAAVEEFVVQHAKCESVGLFIGPTRENPADVRGVQADRELSESNVEATHGAPVFIRGENAKSETGISLPTQDRLEARLECESDGIEDVSVDRFREMAFEE